MTITKQDKDVHAFKTIELLSDDELDSLVACLLTKSPKAKVHESRFFKIFIPTPKGVDGHLSYAEYSPTAYWTHGGPILQEYGISLVNWSGDSNKPEDQCWGAYVGEDYVCDNALCMVSNTQLSAAMKCFCSIKLMDMTKETIDAVIKIAKGVITDASRK